MSALDGHGSLYPLNALRFKLSEGDCAVAEREQRLLVVIIFQSNIVYVEVRESEGGVEFVQSLMLGVSPVRNFSFPSKPTKPKVSWRKHEVSLEGKIYAATFGQHGTRVGRNRE